MAKNILLLFLSDAKTVKRDDKVIIQSATFDGEEIKITNESAVRHLLKKKISLDKIFILASKKIRSDIENYSDDGKPITHLDFFLRRVENILPDTTCETFPYDENISGDENLKSVADMAGKIQNYAAQFKDEEIILHVDLTGGMRHINMMMLDLTRLLEYSGLTVGSLLYSNFGKKTVEELKNIYDLFQLIAGVEEFVNFGSVKALKNYYADKNLSEPLQKLLAAMENFAEAIKLCHYGQFHDAIINLHDAVRDFEPSADDVQDILMARLIERIREDYHRLIVNRYLDDLEVIRWCLEKDYLQQALTLYTERIPEYLGEKRLITQRADESRKLRIALGGDVRSDNFYLLNVYKMDDAEFQSLGKLVGSSLGKMQNQYAALIKSIPDAIKKNLDYDEWHEQLDKLVEKICTNIKLVSNAPITSEHIVCADEKRLRSQYELLAKVAANPQLIGTLRHESFGIIFDKLKPQLDGQPESKKRKLILNELGNLKVDEVKRYFPPLVCRRNAQIFRLKMMIDAQIFDLHFDESIFFSVMEKYFRIKSERNQSAHARADEGEFKSARELRDFMMSGVDELDSVVNK